MMLIYLDYMCIDMKVLKYLTRMLSLGNVVIGNSLGQDIRNLSNQTKKNSENKRIYDDFFSIVNE